MSKGNKQKRVTADEERLLNSLRAVGLTPYLLRINLENVKDVYLVKCPGMILNTPRIINALLEKEWGCRNDQS